MKIKKIGLTLGSIAAVAIPVSAVIACGTTSAPINKLTKMADMDEILKTLGADDETKYSFENKTDEEKKKHVKELVEKFFGDISPEVLPEMWDKITDENYVLTEKDNATFNYLGRLLSKIPFKGGGPAEDYKLSIGSGNFIPGYEENMQKLGEGHFKSIISETRFPSDVDESEIKIILKEQLQLNKDAMKMIDDLVITLESNDDLGELHIKFKYDGVDQDIKVTGFAGYKSKADIIADSKYADINAVVTALEALATKDLTLTGDDVSTIKALLNIELSPKEDKKEDASPSKDEKEVATPLEQLEKIGITITDNFDYKGTKVTFSTFGINHDGKLIIKFEVSNKLEVVPNPDEDEADDTKKLSDDTEAEKVEKEFTKVVYKEIDVTGIDKFYLNKFVEDLEDKSFIKEEAKDDKEATYNLPWISNPNFTVDQVTDEIIVWSLRNMMNIDFRISNQLTINDLDITRDEEKGEIAFKFKADYKVLNDHEFKWTGFKTKADAALHAKNRDYRYLIEAVEWLSSQNIDPFTTYVAPVSITKTTPIDEDVAKELGITLPESWEKHKVQASYYTSGSYEDGTFEIHFIVSHENGKLPVPELNDQLVDKDYQIGVAKRDIDKIIVSKLLATGAVLPQEEKDAYEKAITDAKAALDDVATYSSYKETSKEGERKVKEARASYVTAIKEANEKAFDKLASDAKKLAQGIHENKQDIFDIYSPTKLIYGATLDSAAKTTFEAAKTKAYADLEAITDFGKLADKFTEVKETIEEARDVYQKAILAANTAYEVEHAKGVAKRETFVWNSLTKLLGGAEKPTKEYDALEKTITDGVAAIEAETTKDKISDVAKEQAKLIGEAEDAYNKAVLESNKEYNKKEISEAKYFLASKEITTTGLAKEAVDRLILGLKIGQKKSVFVRFPSTYSNSPELQNVLVYFDVQLNEINKNKGVDSIDNKLFVKLLFDTLYANPQRKEQPKLPDAESLIKYLLRDDQTPDEDIEDSIVLSYLKNLDISLNLVKDKELTVSNERHILRDNSVDGNTDSPVLLKDLFGVSYDALRTSIGKFAAAKYKYKFQFQLIEVKNAKDNEAKYNLEVIFYKKTEQIKETNKILIPIFAYDDSKEGDYDDLTRVAKDMAKQTVSFLMPKDGEYKPSDKWQELTDYTIFGESYIKALPKKEAKDGEPEPKEVKDERLDKWLKTNSNTGYKVEYKFTGKLENNIINGITLRLSKNGVSIITTVPYYNLQLHSMADFKSKLGESWNYNLEKAAQDKYYRLIMQKIIEESEFDLSNKTQIAHIFSMLGQPKNYQELFQKQQQAVYLVKLYLITNKIVRDLLIEEPENEYLKKATSIEKQHELLEMIAFANALSVDEYIKRTGMTGEDLAFRNNYEVLREYFEKTKKLFVISEK